MPRRTPDSSHEDFTMLRPAFALVASFLLFACTTPQDEPPADPDTGTDAGDDDDDGNPSSADDDDDDGSGTDDDTTGDTNSTVDTTAGDTGEECLGENDCWNCTPRTSEQLLNHCTDATCEPFEDSAKRLPLLERDGSLPPLP